MKKHSVKIAGHDTSVTLENEFWTELKKIADERDMSLNCIISEIDQNKKTDNLSSALRLYVLETLRCKH